jgi:DNA uptake protein ComE-like DNA-binding protein
MQTTGVEFQQILELAPDWQPIVNRVQGNGTINSAVAAEFGKNTACLFAVFEDIGQENIFQKLQKHKQEQAKWLKLVRDNYLLVLANRMFKSNSAMRRFLSERRYPSEDQKGQLVSMAVELAIKLETGLKKHLDDNDAQGFKLMLPAYIQRSVNNAVIDFIRSESHWERQSATDSTEEGEEDAIARAADDTDRIPEQQILSGEKIGYLNQLRQKLKAWYKDPSLDPSLLVVDCMFGLGLTEHSTLGKELTMRECCDLLKLEGETQARKIARCQVLLDKGMDKIRHLLRTEMPGVVDCWQKEVNVNVASRRDLNHQLDLTEGEIDRLVIQRQYMVLDQLVDRAVVKPEKLPALKRKGAVAAFVPVDMNAATARELTDILGIGKDTAQKIVALRPLSSFEQLIEVGLLTPHLIDSAKKRGAVLKKSAAGGSADLNIVELAALERAGLSNEQASIIKTARPFESWAELEEFLCGDEQTYNCLRKNFSLVNRSS